jgi:hypothetical protein
MEPAAFAATAAEHVRQSLAGSSVWEAALTGAVVRMPPAAVGSLLAHEPPYYLVEMVRGGAVTARFVVDAAGTLLEAEGVRSSGAQLRPFVDPPRPRTANRSPQLVWKACDQSTTRLRPFWHVADTGPLQYVRVDGETFNDLTTIAGVG